MSRLTASDRTFARKLHEVRQKVQQLKQRLRKQKKHERRI